MTDSESHPIVLFDGVCNFCDASVNWIIAHERKALLRFAALQSPAGERLQREYGLDPTALDTLVLIEAGRTYRKSGAALRIMRRLRWPWPVLFGLVVVPAFIRDFAYGWFARRRYQWFGRKDECMAPSAEVRERFLVD
jgi:predicted DCC family thiol-disulfide oxidoreductase YuxK